MSNFEPPKSGFPLLQWKYAWVWIALFNLHVLFGKLQQPAKMVCGSIVQEIAFQLLATAWLVSTAFCIRGIFKRPATSQSDLGFSLSLLAMGTILVGAFWFLGLGRTAFCSVINSGVM